MGRDLGYFQVVRDSDISIHAPSWGATILSDENSLTLLISIHAPSWGATYYLQAHSHSARDFNPRALVGRDPTSISSTRISTDFNPRALVGRDPKRCNCPYFERYFNPRALVGRDRPQNLLHQPDRHFNPRALVGRDGWSSGVFLRWSSFQSTRPRGARLIFRSS